MSGPISVIRVDPAPGFASLCNDELLSQYGFALEVGRVKKADKNPVAEKSDPELGNEPLRVCPEGGTMSRQPTSTPVSVTGDCLPARCGFSAINLTTLIFFSDLQVFRQQHSLGLRNHPASEKSKVSGWCPRSATPVEIGDLVYIASDGSLSCGLAQKLHFFGEALFLYISYYFLFGFFHFGDAQGGNSFRVRGITNYLVGLVSLHLLA